MTEERTFPRANVREVSKLLCFSMIRVVSGEKKRLVKAAGAESCGQRRHSKLQRCSEKNLLVLYLFAILFW